MSVPFASRVWSTTGLTSSYRTLRLLGAPEVVAAVREHVTALPDAADAGEQLRALGSVARFR